MPAMRRRLARYCPPASSAFPLAMQFIATKLGNHEERLLVQIAGSQTEFGVPLGSCMNAPAS
jgi:hypothetical protein